jgi:hypothetical protein
MVPDGISADISYRKTAPGMFTTINLPSGTHHVKFVVDGDMVTSPDLPTAVDFNNFLVNYIEIATEDISKPRRESTQPGTKASTLAPEDQSEQATSGQQTPDDSEIDEPQLEEIPAGDWRQIIPPYLIDADLHEDDPKAKDATECIQAFGGPPGLPMFLGRSILNGILPVKDDNSVLTLPNHTVLNHLMTSSVKNGVLATSVTTRYKKKVRKGWLDRTMMTTDPCRLVRNYNLVQTRTQSNSGRTTATASCLRFPSGFDCALAGTFGEKRRPLVSRNDLWNFIWHVGLGCIR